MRVSPLLLCVLAVVARAEAPAGMVLVPAGEFTMGANRGDADERPAHVVVLDAYYIGKHEVTNAEYMAFWTEASSHTPVAYDPDAGWAETAAATPDHPVVGVTWEDAMAYAEWRDMRLPTEAEWEKAARGVDERLYPWGNTMPDADARSIRLANIQPQSDPADGAVAAVGSYPSDVSPYGVFDTAGNVSEWVADTYSATYYHHSLGRNPAGAQHGSWRVVRGGSWAADRDEALAVNRRGQHPRAAASFIGFRIVKDAE